MASPLQRSQVFARHWTKRLLASLATKWTIARFKVLRHLRLCLQLRAEQRRIVEKHGKGFGRAAMAEMRYAEALSREVLRIWGPADILFRRAHTAVPCFSASALPLERCYCPACCAVAFEQCWLYAGTSELNLQYPKVARSLACTNMCCNHKVRSPHPCCASHRLVKEDFELHGKRIRKGATILASMLYAKACDPRLSAGDHVVSAVPLHMDIHQLHASVKPERWLDPSNKLDLAVRPPAARPSVLTGSAMSHACLAICAHMQTCQLQALVQQSLNVSRWALPAATLSGGRGVASLKQLLRQQECLSLDQLLHCAST